MQGCVTIVTVRTNDLFERPGTGALVVVGQVLVRQQFHIDRLVQAFHRVMKMHLRLTSTTQIAALHKASHKTQLKSIMNDVR